MDNKVDLAKIEEYNNEPVYYCRACLSLRIMSMNDKISFCDTCGSTDIDACHINEWEKLYREKYGKDYIKTKKINI